MLFRVGRFRTGDLKCEAFYNKAKQPRSGASPVRIWLSRRRKLHIACDDFLCFASKAASRSFRCSASQNQNRMAATGLVANFGPPLCRVLILRGRGIAEIAPHGSEKADAKARVFSVGDGALDVPKPSLGGRWPRSGRMREGRPSRPSSVSLPLDSFPPGEAMSGRGVPVPGRRSADCGGDAFTLQRLMGHSTLNMTKHYCSIYDADIAKNYDRVSPLAQIQKPRETIKM